MFKHWFPRGSLRAIVAGNTISQLTGRAISSVSMIVVSFLIARQFGAVGYGDFIKITTYVGFFYLFSDYGLNAIFIQREAAHDGEHRDARLWRTLLGLRIVLGGTLAVVAAGIMFLIPSGYDQGYTGLVRLGIYLLLPAIVLQAVITTTNAYFQKMLRYDLSALAQSAGSLSMVVTAVALTFIPLVGGPILGTLSLFIGSMVTAAAALFLITPLARNIRPIVHFSRYRSLFLAATPLGFALIFNLIYFHADSVILALTRPTGEVGIYGLAYKVFELPLVIPIFFMNSVYPLWLRPTQHKQRSDRNIFTTSFVFLVLSAMVIGVMMWFSAPFVTLIRPEFAQSVMPLRVLLLGLPVFFVSALLMWFLIAKKLQSTLLLIHGIAMGMNIVANIIFVPVFGYMAAAWITISSEAFVLAMSGLVAWRRGV